MERLKCSVRSLRDDDRGMLVLLAEETLHPLAEGSGHPELYCASDLLELLDRADVYVGGGRRRDRRLPAPSNPKAMR